LRSALGELVGGAGPRRALVCVPMASNGTMAGDAAVVLTGLRYSEGEALRPTTTVSAGGGLLDHY
jgi:hypothetical protein